MDLAEAIMDQDAATHTLAMAETRVVVAGRDTDTGPVAADPGMVMGNTATGLRLSTDRRKHQPGPNRSYDSRR